MLMDGVGRPFSTSVRAEAPARFIASVSAVMPVFAPTWPVAGLRAPWPPHYH